jgi:SpoVK/Ycf46/Vps4 family AAA+-type ATPase
MRAALVIKLVEAFHLGTLPFRQAVEILAEEESKKGNDSVAEKLMNALNQNKERFEASTNDVAPKNNNAFFSISRVTPPQNPPKDKDSLLSLFEIIEPSIGFEQLFFASDVSNVFKQIIREWGQSDVLFEAGMAPSRRILLHGPPGCGKTVAGLALAKAIQLPVAYVRLDGLFSSFLGQTSANLRRVFEAVASPPHVLFLDEFDAVAKKRDDSQEIGEIKRIVISLLQNLDFLPPEVLVIAATNHSHLLDPAIWRRFDVSLHIGFPEENVRKTMIEAWLCNQNVQAKVNFDQLATITEQLSISRIKDIVFQTIKNSIVTKGTLDVSTDDFIQQLIFMEGYRQSKTALLEFAQRLRGNGMTLNNIGKITGIPKSTISDHTTKKGNKK